MPDRQHQRQALACPGPALAFGVARPVERHEQGFAQARAPIIGATKSGDIQPGPAFLLGRAVAQVGGKAQCIEAQTIDDELHLRAGSPRGGTILGGALLGAARDHPGAVIRRLGDGHLVGRPRQAVVCQAAQNPGRLIRHGGGRLPGTFPRGISSILIAVTQARQGQTISRNPSHHGKGQTHTHGGDTHQLHGAPHLLTSDTHDFRPRNGSNWIPFCKAYVP